MQTLVSKTELLPDMVLEVFASISHLAVSSPALIGVSLAASLFLVSVAAISYFCYRGGEEAPWKLVYRPGAGARWAYRPVPRGPGRGGRRQRRPPEEGQSEPGESSGSPLLSGDDSENTGSGENPGSPLLSGDGSENAGSAESSGSPLLSGDCAESAEGVKSSFSLRTGQRCWESTRPSEGGQESAENLLLPEPDRSKLDGSLPSPDAQASSEDLLLFGHLWVGCRRDAPAADRRHGAAARLLAAGRAGQPQTALITCHTSLPSHLTRSGSMPGPCSSLQPAASAQCVSAYERERGLECRTASRDLPAAPRPGDGRRRAGRLV
ncbi:uncharacterized protein LOC119100811 [Pollicipes pollicipes]|uniref:uncharacterized protein LOC119100811 n=1 Tax=Pollicipes pollicipes TaxID=41117 RepID=UPI0018858F90|nr:uncharacterized protein LOC119100811 [Pollicipes pollicipes]